MPTQMIPVDSIDADYEVTPSQLESLLVNLMPTGVPIMIWGPPGVGKSAISKQVAFKLKRLFYDFRVNLIEPHEIKGLPWFDKDHNVTRHAPPELFPPSGSTDKFVLCYDELAAGLPSVQAALYQPLTDNCIGSYHLPEDTYQIACSNKLCHRSVSYEMPAAVVRRFRHVNVKSSLEDWCDWAARNRLSPDVIFYLQYEKKMLNNFDQVEEENEPFACEATWHMASKIRTNGCQFDDPYLERAAYVGTVGKAAGIGFTSFLQFKDNLPHPRQILLDPDTAPVPEHAGERLAACGALANLANPANIAQVYTYLKRLGRELTEFTMGAIVKAQPDLKKEPTFIHWVSEKTDPAVPLTIATALP